MKNFLFFILFLVSTPLWSTHIVGGNIQYRCLGFGQYEISLVQYRDCSGIPMNPTRIVLYSSTSCGVATNSLALPLVSVSNISPVCSQLANSTTCTGGGLPGVEQYIYRDTVSLPQNCTDWQFTAYECCWNSSVVNIVPNDYFTRTTLNDLDFYCNNSVTFAGRGIVYANIGQPNVYAPLGTDADGDVLKYRLTSALQNTGFPATYQGGYNPLNPINILQGFDTLTGNLTFRPMMIGSFVIAYNVEEYRNNRLVATTHRVIQIIVGNYGTTQVPVPSVNNVVGGSSVGDSVFACVGTPLQFQFTFTDPDPNDSIGIIQTLSSQLPGVNFTISGTNPKIIQIQWTPPFAGVFPVSVVVENLGCPFTLNAQVADLTIFVTDNMPRLTASDFYLCSSPNVLISAPPGYLSYSWNTGASTPFIQVNSPGIYSVTTTGGSCGSNVDSIEIFDAPEIFIGNDTSIYLGDTIQLNAQLLNGLSPGKFVDTIVSVVIPSVGVFEVNLNVQNVFPTIVDSFILEKSIVDLDLLSGTDSLEIYLSSPSGVMIPLSRRRGGPTNIAYDSTSFDPYATDPISSYVNVIPSDSTFVPEGNWNLLFNSAVNGRWKLLGRQLKNGTGIINYFALKFGGGFQYNWFPSQGLSCTDCPDPLASPDTTTTYYFSLTNILGCTSYDTITIFVQPRWSIDTIRAWVAEDSSIQICPSLPTNFGQLQTSAVLLSPNQGNITNLNNGCFVYEPNAAAEYTDSFMVVLCNNQGFCDTTYYIISTISCVWPGDCNDDNLVDHTDLLPIGLGYGINGTTRANASLNFNCQPHFNWNLSTPVTNIDYKHSDTDGSSLINDDDTLAIVQNWGLSHLRPEVPVYEPHLFSFTPGNGIMVEYGNANPGDWVNLNVVMGDQSNVVDSAYGLAFTIFYDATMIDQQSVQFFVDSSWLGNPASDLIYLARDQYNFAQLKVAITRKDHQNRSGQGKFASIRFKVNSQALGTLLSKNLIMGVGQIQLIDKDENSIYIEGKPSYVVVSQPQTAVSISEQGNVQIYPNPSRDWLQIDSDRAFETFEIVDALGRCIKNGQIHIDKKIPVGGIQAGFYYLRIQGSGQSFSKRIQIVE